MNSQILLKLETIQKLGAFFRTHYPDWKIVLLSNWREEGQDFIREILHEGGGEVLVYARVDVPRETFLHFQQQLQDLGSQSIGDSFLFLIPHTRDPFEIVEEAEKYPVARRSRFWVEGLPLVITEYFTAAGLQCLRD